MRGGGKHTHYPPCRSSPCAQVPKGVLRAVTYHKRGACAAGSKKGPSGGPLAGAAAGGTARLRQRPRTVLRLWVYVYFEFFLYQLVIRWVVGFLCVLVHCVCFVCRCYFLFFNFPPWILFCVIFVYVSIFDVFLFVCLPFGAGFEYVWIVRFETIQCCACMVRLFLIFSPRLNFFVLWHLFYCLVASFQWQSSWFSFRCPVVSMPLPRRTTIERCASTGWSTPPWPLSTSQWSPVMIFFCSNFFHMFEVFLLLSSATNFQIYKFNWVVLQLRSTIETVLLYIFMPFLKNLDTIGQSIDLQFMNRIFSDIFLGCFF